MLGVPKGKLTSWSNLRLRAIDPAVAEVCALSDYMVEITPIKTGRSVTHVELRWWRKDGQGEAQADRALRFASPGRRARAEGRVDQLVPAETVPEPAPDPAPEPPPARPELRPRPAWLDRKGVTLRTDTYETARLRFPGYDIYFVEGEWRDWSAGKGAPEDPDRAFLAFFRRYAEANPI